VKYKYLYICAYSTVASPVPEIRWFPSNEYHLSLEKVAWTVTLIDSGLGYTDGHYEAVPKDMMPETKSHYERLLTSLDYYTIDLPDDIDGASSDAGEYPDFVMKERK
jgi:hypothetical protein